MKQLTLIVFSIISLSACSTKTVVSIVGEQFYINGSPTYEGVYWDGHKIEGLLMNSRMVQGIFDDLNPETREDFKYPDTGVWDPDRNTREFVEAMPSWREHGLLAFTLNLQGGSPVGYGNKECINSTFDTEGELRPEYIKRLKMILDEANDLGMVVILGYFYFRQDQRLKDESAVLNAVDNITNWILENNYRNVIVEINNECNILYDHPILQPERVHELIDRVKSIEINGNRLLVSTSYGGGTLPKSNVVRSSDFILLHGNGMHDPSSIPVLVESTRRVEGYKPKPVVFNEDDHYDFENESNNMVEAIKSYASWGYFDFRRDGEPFEDGFQTVPADWKISSERKQSFFSKLKEVTGGK
jgi:hypothetical protein